MDSRKKERKGKPAVTKEPRGRAMTPHLFVHEYVDKRVDDGGELGQQRRHDARLRGQKVTGAEGREQSCHPIGQPADQVAHHHRDNHQHHPLLSAAGHHCAHTADLAEKKKLHWCIAIAQSKHKNTQVRRLI